MSAATTKRRVYPMGPPLTEEQVAVTFAMTSRSPEPFDQIAEQVSETRAADFNERWVRGYGHASVAEHAGVHLAIEGFSRLATDALESNRLASYTERSSRYQRIAAGDYHVPSELEDQPALRGEYMSTMDLMFRSYEESIAAITQHLERTRPQDPEESERARSLAIWRETVDSARALLPAATLTNVGMTANARTFAHAITKLLSDPLMECQELGGDIRNTAAAAAPTLVKYAEYNEQVARTRRAPPAPPPGPPEPRRAILLSWDEDAGERIARGLKFPETSGTSDATMWATWEREAEAAGIISDALDGRTEHDPTPRALELAAYQAEIRIDYGGLRELRRHRMMTPISQPLRVGHGVEMPPLFQECDCASLFRHAMEQAESLYWKLHNVSAEVAQYAVSHAHLQGVLVSLNARELVELLRLRTSRRAHRSIRLPCAELEHEIRGVQPDLMNALLGPATGGTMAKETETTRELIVRLTKSLGAYGGKAVITDQPPSDDEIASGTLETFDIQLDTALAEHHVSVAIRRPPARSVMFATSVRRGNGGRDTWDGPATEQGWGRMMTALMAFEAMLKDPEATSYPANANALAERPDRPE